MQINIDKGITINFDRSSKDKNREDFPLFETSTDNNVTINDLSYDQIGALTSFLQNLAVLSTEKQKKEFPSDKINDDLKTVELIKPNSFGDSPKLSILMKLPELSKTEAFKIDLIFDQNDIETHGFNNATIKANPNFISFGIPNSESYIALKKFDQLPNLTKTILKELNKLDRFSVDAALIE